jgi:RimJ/RimL family protein N-acetyltransferase
LREVRESDVEHFFTHQLDERANRMAAFGAKDPRDRAGYLGRWMRLLGDPTITARTIVRGEEIVGHVVRFVGPEGLEVFYWLAAQYWGWGYATLALRLFLSENPARPLWARVARENIASRRVLEKCGFVKQREERGFSEARGAEVEELVLLLA